MKLTLLALFCLAVAVASDGHGHEHGGQSCSHDHGEPQVRYAPVNQWPRVRMCHPTPHHMYMP
jgi:hypothetical protein